MALYPSAYKATTEKRTLLIFVEYIYSKIKRNGVEGKQNCIIFFYVCWISIILGLIIDLHIWILMVLTKSLNTILSLYVTMFSDVNIPMHNFSDITWINSILSHISSFVMSLTNGYYKLLVHLSIINIQPWAAITIHWNLNKIRFLCITHEKN